MSLKQIYYIESVRLCGIELYSLRCTCGRGSEKYYLVTNPGYRKALSEIERAYLSAGKLFEGSHEIATIPKQCLDDCFVHTPAILHGNFSENMEAQRLIRNLFSEFLGHEHYDPQSPVAAREAVR